MPQKKTIEEVREFIREKSGGKCELLSKEYVNDRTPLLLRCSCGNEFTRKYCKLRRGYFTCRECSLKQTSESYRADISDVIKVINSTGCKYLGGDYINNTSRLTIKCRCGNVFKKRYIDFIKGQDRCPECGKKRLSLSKTKYTEDDVKEKIAEKGYTLLEEYKNCYTKVKCKCSKGHIFYLEFDRFLNGKSGCQLCRDDSIKSSGHWNYKGGCGKVREGLRLAVKPWRKRIEESYSYTCPITGETENITVHHFTPFCEIVDSACKRLGIENHYNGVFSDYADYNEYDRLKELVMSEHNFDTGILLSRKVHLQFHKLYGKTGNTEEQFDDFLRKYYNTTLLEVRKKQIVPATDCNA